MLSDLFMLECGRMHEFCPDSFPCPYCEFKWPLRWKDGTFAPYKAMEESDE